jgi:hypothetical protein
VAVDEGVESIGEVGLRIDGIEFAGLRSLEPVLPAEMVGLWRGVGIPSGHPLDGVLENLQWFGKRFDADLRADALLFQWRPGRLVPIEPSFFPMGLVIRLAPLGRT